MALIVERSRAPGDDDETLATLDMIRRVYRRLSRWYGYVFFLANAESNASIFVYKG